MAETYPVAGAHRGITTADGRRFQMWDYGPAWVVQEYGDRGAVVQSLDGQPDARACERIVQQWRSRRIPDAS